MYSILTYAYARTLLPSSTVTHIQSKLHQLLIRATTACNATHGIAKAILSVCLSLHLPVKRMHCDKTKETSVHMLIPHDMKDHSSQFSHKNNGRYMGQLLLGEILGQTDHVRAKTPIFNRYSLVAPQP